MGPTWLVVKRITSRLEPDAEAAEN